MLMVNYHLQEKLLTVFIDFPINATLFLKTWYLQVRFCDPSTMILHAANKGKQNNVYCPP